MTWRQSPVQRMSHNNLPFSFKEFVRQVSKVKDPKLNTRRQRVDDFVETRDDLYQGAREMLERQHDAMTLDGWTSCSNDTYHSFTSSFIDDEFDLHELAMGCKKMSGKTAGTDLVDNVKGMIDLYGMAGRVTAAVTDCEPPMVVCGRELKEKDITTHIGCCNHRFECTTALVFNGPGVKRTMAIQRALVTRYTKSSQMADRLEEMCGIFKVPSLQVVEDVETRWNSTFSSVERTKQLRDAIQLHERLDNIAALLADDDWEVLKLIEPILQSLMEAQMELEGAKYVTGSLVVPYVHNLRRGLEKAMSSLNGMFTVPGLSDSVQSRARAIVSPCVEALWEDFINRWGTGKDILTVRKGRGVSHEVSSLRSCWRLLCTLDPRTFTEWKRTTKTPCGRKFTKRQ